MGEKHDIPEGLLAACAAGGPSLSELAELRQAMGEEAWRRASDEAQVAANYLRCHPAVSEVRYPGLTSDPDYREASSTLRGGFGPLVRIRLAPAGGAGGAAAAPRWLELDTRRGPGDARDLVFSLEIRLKGLLGG